jgi:hypothetical protein
VGHINKSTGTPGDINNLAVGIKSTCQYAEMSGIAISPRRYAATSKAIQSLSLRPIHKNENNYP